MTPAAQTLVDLRGSRLLLDSNLLLLLLIGTLQPTLIRKFKRTASYTEQEFDTLLTVVSQFQTLVTTPHLLTEVNGLANSLPDHVRYDFSSHLAENIARFSEIFMAATEITTSPVFSKFGLADAALHLASERIVVVTDDLRLTAYLRSQNRDVWNLRQSTREEN